ncbi:Serine carboxypeptidase-like 40 [Hibiscus syriacus]|uniref:Serine carboxypeptidase-like 40 n=1 Tax=Hibiscus syriacus TaxID=106335 RepID=A0A6A2YJH1_HIBSY|nr:Serine carboxypeptidase-like 40 [Hibiscus syriacus]
MALVLLAHATLPMELLSYAIIVAAQLINKLPTKVLQGLSPTEKLLGKKPNYSELKVFGCQCFPHLRPFQTHKLAFWSQPCTYLGVSPQHKGFLCLAADGKIYVSRHVVFNETMFPFVGKSAPVKSRVIQNHRSQPIEIVSNKQFAPVQQPTHSGTPDSIESGETLPLNMEGVSESLNSPTEVGTGFTPESGYTEGAVQESSSVVASNRDTSEINGNFEANSKIPASEAIPSSEDNDNYEIPPAGGRSHTNIHPMLTRDKCGIYKPKAYSSQFDEVVPSTIDEALQSPKWDAAVQEEYDALKINGTWTLVKLPSGRVVVGCKWFVKVKRNPNGSVHRYKARLVAKGFSQVPGYDYLDTFSPIVKFTTLNVILSVAVTNNWELRHVDINNAFLNRDLREAIFIQQPPGFEQSAADGVPLVCQLQKWCRGALMLSQKKFILELLRKIGMENSSPCATPMVLTPKPELAFSVGKGAQFMHAPHASHLPAVKRIRRYLAGTLEYGLVFLSSKARYAVSAFADADWVANVSDRRSVSGFGVFLDNHLVAWSSKKQKTVSRSTMEAEYKSLADNTAEVTWISTLIDELGLKQHGKSVIWCDNTGAVAMSANPVYQSQSKHVDLDVHFVREKKQTEALTHLYMNKTRASSGIDKSHLKPIHHINKTSVHPQQGMKGKDIIQMLPRQPRVSLEQYGGYVIVDKSVSRALYYYFMEAQHYAKESLPLLLWLNGGPGCSSLAYGAMEELGPSGFIAMEKHFTKIDTHGTMSPAGIGFSYSNTTSDYDKSGDSKTAVDNYVFLLNWLERFPEYKNREFYIAGESYAGHYVPQLAHTILQHNIKANQTLINLKGILVANFDPCSDDCVHAYLNRADVQEAMHANVGGYTEVYKGGLTSATERGAGHQVPSFQPKRALSLIWHFLPGDLTLLAISSFIVSIVFNRSRFRENCIS